MLGRTLFAVSLLPNMSFLLFLPVSFVIRSAARMLFHFNPNKYIRTLVLAFRLLLTFFVAYFEAFNANYVHCILLLCLQSPKRQLLPFGKNFNIEKCQRYLVCCLVVFKYFSPAIFCHFYMKLHERLLSCCSFHSKYRKYNLFVFL